MHSAVELRADHDLTDVPAIVRGAVKLGLLESVLVLVISLVSRFLPNGVLQTALLAVIVLVGLAAVTLLPGLWTRPRTIEGIAGRRRHRPRRGRDVFLLIDVTLLQNIGTYGHRWLRPRRRQQLVVSPGLVDGRHVPAVDGRVDPREPARQGGRGVARPRRSALAVACAVVAAPSSPC